MQLSPHFTLAQLTASETAASCGIDNTPPSDIVANLRTLAAQLERVRSLLGHALDISSGYRCPALNEAVGGAASSQHCQGLAVDFECPAFGSPADIARAIAGSDIAFDTLILEYGRWVHLSFTAEPRRRVLSIYEDGNGYRDGLWTAEGAPLEP
jgi:zinc D-Ala-D-Ala carboxypeptidase